MINEKITEMIMTATKNRETDKAAVYKLIKNEFLKYKTAKNAKPLDESTEIALLQKMVKQREDSISMYKEGNRMDLAQNEQNEIDILLTLLPKMPTIEDATNWMLSNYPEGISKDKMGFVIKEMKIALPGVDGKMCADFVKKSLI